ncbi:MAG: phage holin family protein [Oligoflexia bacterium]|nr:phage holin family protein [Oligoflexia bacterium]
MNSSPYSQILREIADSFQALLRSEIHLARAETKETLTQLSHKGAAAALFAVLALGGLLPLLAFLVIGLGKLLGDNYWLSSLLIGMAMLAVGGLLARQQLKKIAEQNKNLPILRESIREQRLTVEKKLEELTETRRSA